MKSARARRPDRDRPAPADARRDGRRPAAIPRGLSAETRRWYARVAADYAIEDPAGAALLEVAARAWERALQARRQLEAEGPTIRDRWGQRRTHPAAAVERDAYSIFLRAVRELQLDAEPIRRPGRPGGA